MALDWQLLLVSLLVLLSLSQYNNGAAGSSSLSSLNCTDIDWSALNVSNTTRLGEVFEQCLAENSLYEDCPDPGLCLDDGNGNSDPAKIGLAFGLTIGAGLSTTIGAMIPFIPCIRRTNTKILAISLSLAAGVMLYVSFTEIFGKSKAYICCITQQHFNLIGDCCFFFGILLTVLLDLLVAGLEKIKCNCLPWSDLLSHCRRSTERRLSQSSVPGANRDVTLEERPVVSCVNGVLGGGAEHEVVVMETITDGDHGAFVPSNNDSPMLPAHVADLSLPDNDFQTERRSISAGSNTVSTTTNNLGDASIQDLLSNTSIHRMHTVAESVSNNIETGSISINNENYDGFSLNPSLRTQSLPNGDVHSRVSAPSLQRRASYEEMVEQQEDVGTDAMDQFREVTHVLTDTHKLKRMGLLTGLALALHNFPEGLATFVATLSDPSFGGALAIAIALHNIPEGICVSMPVYYATGSRLKAFFWAFLSGISEPIGALFGWAILQRIFGPVVYGIAFGLISGMMVYVALKELIPTAYKFDDTNGILVIIFIVIGMIVMALSLVLLAY